MERVVIHAPTVDGQPAADPAAPVLVITGAGDSFWADLTDEIRDLLAGRQMCHAYVEIAGQEMTIVGEAPDTLQ